MSGESRFDVEAVLERGGRERLIGGGFGQLVTLRLFNGAGVVDATGAPTQRPAVFCDLRPEEARELAFELLALAEHAERMGEAR